MPSNDRVDAAASLLHPPALCWGSACGCLSPPESVSLPRVGHTKSFPAGYPLSSASRMVLLCLAADSGQDYMFSGSPGSPVSLCLPPLGCQATYERSVTRRSGRWPARTRHGGCCGCWRRRRCSRVATKTPCWSGSSPTTAPRKGARKVREGLEPQGHASAKQRSSAMPCLPTGHNPLLPSDKPRHFLLGHSSGTNWVEYDATGWLNHVKHNPASQNASVLLQESQKYVGSQGGKGAWRGGRGDFGG